MELRKALLPTERTLEFKEMLRSKIQIIEGKLDNGEDVYLEIDEFNTLTGRDYNLDFFRNYWSSMSIDEFVLDACSPTPGRIPDITREELIEIVRRIKDIDRYGQYTDFYLELLEANVAMPDVSDLIFWSEEELTPEQVVDRALSYKPISL